MDLTILFVMLGLLVFKHWVVDFVFQSDAMIAGKGTYGDARGMLHSFQHGYGTAFVMLCGFMFAWVYLATGYGRSTLDGPMVVMGPLWCVMCGVLDAIVHYHVDYVKARWGSRDPKTKAFWNHLGADQMVHQFTYLAIAWWTFS